MPVADFAPPRRLLAGAGPSTPDERVLRALTTPVIGQFDPAFTALMDEVMQLARAALLTRNVRCFPVSGLASAGLEALINTLVEPGDRVAVLGSDEYVGTVTDVVRRYGGVPDDTHLYRHTGARDGTSVVLAAGGLTIVPHVDPWTAEATPLAALAEACHRQDSLLIVDATLSLAARELRTDDWGLDAVVAGVDRCVGAPSGMALVTYSEQVEQRMLRRTVAAPTSYLDLVQLQAYWSAERLNHHTAPTSLIYGLREALRVLQEESLEVSWQRHERVAVALRAGLAVLGLASTGDTPLAIVQVEDGERRRRQLLDEYGVYVDRGVDSTWRIGLLGADARMDACAMVLAALERAFGGA
jgi:(S)-ureidoglycine-glyoxylate aminotransferase